MSKILVFIFFIAFKMIHVIVNICICTFIFCQFFILTKWKGPRNYCLGTSSLRGRRVLNNRVQKWQIWEDIACEQSLTKLTDINQILFFSFNNNWPKSWFICFFFICPSLSCHTYLIFVCTSLNTIIMRILTTKLSFIWAKESGC